jgi:hypothetical protein
VPLTQLNPAVFPTPRSSFGVFSCQWRGVADPESGVWQYEIAIGIGSPTDQSVLSRVVLDSQLSRSSYVSPVIPSLVPSQPYYITLYATNGAELETITTSEPVYFDISSPLIRNGVSVIPNFKAAEYIMGVLSNLTFGVESAMCLFDTDVVSIMFDRPEDSESGEIFTYELGIGLIPGSDDISKYEIIFPIPLPAAAGGGAMLYHRIRQLNFAPIGRRGVYISVRAHNVAGLYSTLVSKAVFIKSNLTMERSWIYDGIRSGPDVDYQTPTYEIGSSFFFGVNCPIRRGRWAVESVDGNLTQAYFDLNIPPFENSVRNTFHVISDQVQLFDDETYRILVQATDFSGEVHILRSDGITVTTTGLIPGIVRDGPIPEQDLNYQESVNTLTACWSGFGDGSPEQAVAYYLVAAGSDREHPSTRSNIAPFNNVGLNMTHTFTGLNLNAESALYFITVRAYSVAGMSVEAHSNGIVAGFGHSIIPGVITLPRFQADATTLSAYWSEFESSLPIRQYEWALGSAYFSSDQLEGFCTDTNSNFSSYFDISGFNLAGLDTSIVARDLGLQDNTTYYLTLRVLDQAKKCIAVTSPDGVTIDQTPPIGDSAPSAVVLGPVQSRRGDAEYVIYISDSAEIEIEWTPFEDEESGIDYYEVGIYQQLECGNDSALGEAILGLTRAESGDMQIVFDSVLLEAGVAYVSVVQAVNRAGVMSRTYSQPILQDTTAPTPGIVKDGVEWNRDIVYQSDLSMLSAVFTHAKLPPLTPGVTSSTPCPRARFFDLLSLDPEWNTVPSPNLVGNFTSNIGYRDAQVMASQSGVRITMFRDRGSSSNEVLTGAYQVNADLSSGGSFQADITVAQGLLNLQMNAVTSILFIDSGEISNTLAKFEPAQPNFNNFAGFGAFGVQVYTDFSNGGTTVPRQVVLWATNPDTLSQPVFVRQELPGFDLTTSNTYRVEFEVEQQDTGIVRSAHLYINDVLIVSLQGLPALTNDTRVVFNLFNQLGYVPPFGDPTLDLSVSAVFANVTVPIPTGGLCDGGTPFHSRESPIAEFRAWAGTKPGLDDVAEMRVSICDFASYDG